MSGKSALTADALMSAAVPSEGPALPSEGAAARSDGVSKEGPLAIAPPPSSSTLGRMIIFTRS